MTILGVPDIVVREVVDVRLELAVVVHVHVGNEMCGKPSFSPPAKP